MTSLSPLSDPATLRAHIERFARDAGADAVRCTSAERDGVAAERFAASLARGDLATWPYDESFAGRAVEPRALLHDARSVVCLAVAYAAAPAASPRGRAGPAGGRVSIYARGDDYHRRVRALARAVAGEIDRIADAPSTYVACDTAPIAERAFAARSGLGWIGKHTNLIAPGLGSYVFLAEILTTLDLTPDAPRATHCGSCMRCVSACPTGALRGDYTMDATRCISDLTQRTDAIPRDLRPLVGTWVWGCDLCQEVCPPTQNAGASSAAAVEEIVDLDLIALLHLRSAEFKRRFRMTALGWRGAAVLRRNAAVALGNALDRSAVPDLERACAGDRSALVRGHAAWALGRIGSPRALAALRARLAADPDASARAEIAAAIGSLTRETPHL